MTEPDPYEGEIAEIAAYLVSGDMREQVLIANLVIEVDLKHFKNDKVVQRFTKSGLWHDLQNPEKIMKVKEAEELIIRQLKEYGISSNSMPTAGI